MRITQRFHLTYGESIHVPNYAQIDRIDPSYYAHSSRINLKDETRINATSDEAEQWRNRNKVSEGIIISYKDVVTVYSLIVVAAPPNFISDIYYLTLALNHYGYQKTISTFEDLSRQHDEMQRHLDMLTGDGSWRGVSIYLINSVSISS